MLPTIDLFPPITRFEIEYLSPTCVRLVGWCEGERELMQTADPHDPEALQDLLNVVEALVCAQAGLDPDTTMNRIRERRHHGQNEHGRKVGPL